MSATGPLDLDGLFKERYADKIEKLIPENAVLIKRIKFVSSEMQEGLALNQPVVVSNESGITIAGPDEGEFQLNSPVSMTMKNARIQATQLVVRSALSYSAAAKAQDSKRAFAKAVDVIVENAMEGGTQRLETYLLYGQDNLGLIASRVNSSATKTVLTIKTSDFAIGLFSGQKNAKVNMYDETGAMISSGDDAIFVIHSVDASTRKVTVTGTATGITALDAKVLANANLCSISFQGRAKEPAGLKKIITNTGSLFGIDASEYDVWKGVTYDAAGALTVAKVQAAIAKAAGNGLNEDTLLMVNPLTWGNLADSLNASQRFDSSYDSKEGKMGVETLKFFSQAGVVEVLPSNMVKEGQAFIVPPKRLKRVGSQDLSFNFPGSQDRIWFDRSEYTSKELRLYTAQALFVEAPARCVFISGIVNS